MSGRECSPRTGARDLDDLITDALRALGLPEDLRDEVRARVDEPDETWRHCCGGFCDPCVSVIARAVDHVRAARRG